MEKLRYHIKEGFKNFWSNGFMSFASIGVLTICLLLLGSSVLISLNVQSLISQIESNNKIMVYLTDSLDQAGINGVESSIRAIPNVKSVTFVSKAQALEDLKKQYGDQAQLLTGMGSDFLPNTYQVEINKMDQYSDTAKKLKAIKGIERINDNSDIASKLTNISRVIDWVGLWMFVILGGVAIFLISNTIKVAVFIRRREINIMKFVGATNGFIRWPFVVEGVIIGAVSGIVGIAAQWVAYIWLIDKLFRALNVTPIKLTAISGFVGAGYLLSGILVGALGSLISLRRHLKV